MPVVLRETNGFHKPLVRPAISIEVRLGGLRLSCHEKQEMLGWKKNKKMDCEVTFTRQPGKMNKETSSCKNHKTTTVKSKFFFSKKAIIGVLKMKGV